MVTAHQTRRELERAGVRPGRIEDRIRHGEPVYRRDVQEIRSYIPVEYADLRRGTIYLRRHASIEGPEQYEVESWDGQERHHISGPYTDREEAVGAWLEAVRA